MRAFLWTLSSWFADACCSFAFLTFVLVGGAFAQEVPQLLPATGWSGTITSSLLQGLLGAGVTGGGLGSAVLYQLLRLAQQKRKTEAARTEGLIEQNTSGIEQSKSGIVRQVLAEAAGLAVANKTAKAPNAPLLFKGKDLQASVEHARQALAEYGITIDSDILRARIRAKLGEIVVGRLAGVATPPPPPASS